MASAGFVDNIDDVLDDLFTRFLMNLPREELTSHSRLGFQLEQAFWFYDDFYRAENRQLPKFNLKTFSIALLGRYPEWTAANGINVEQAITEFVRYKAQVPTCGAIILNEGLTKCLMVKGFHSSSTWGFPKGKIAKGETPEECAVREVQEEIGFDIGPNLSPEDYIQIDVGPHAIRLYIIPGVSESETKFYTKTRKEIGAIQWFATSELSSSTTAKFYNVSTFIGRLKAWIKRYRRSMVAQPSPNIIIRKQDDYPDVLPTQSQQPKKGESSGNGKKSTLKKILKKTGEPKIQPESQCNVFSFNRKLIEQAFTNAWNAIK